MRWRIWPPPFDVTVVVTLLLRYSKSGRNHLNSKETDEGARSLRQRVL
jgi:hypothetical protein